MWLHGNYGPKLGKKKLHLDLFKNSGAAYSLRRLSNSYLGNCIRVRRSSDNIETDIGFIKNVLDVVKLQSFIGASSGFVTTWYDQSGNGRNATQTTTGNQPRIINAGVLDSINGFPAIQFDSHLLNITWTGFSSLNYISSVNVIAPALASAANTGTHSLWGYDAGGGSAAARGMSYFTSTGTLAGETMAFIFSNATVDGGRLGKTTNFSNRANELMSLFTINTTSGSSFEKNRAINTQLTWQLTLNMAATTNTAPSNCGTSSTSLYIKSIGGATNTVSQKYLECIFYTTPQENVEHLKHEVTDHYKIF